MSGPILYDLFCKQGGAAMGYAQAGFKVYGFDLDVKSRNRYPFFFVHAEAVSVLADLAEGRRIGALPLPDVIHASPPCQAYSNAQKINGNAHTDLISPIRELLDDIGLPYVIENVPGSPLRDPVELCGAMFGLGTYRHRLFESNIPLTAPAHPAHVARTTKMGRKPKPGEMMHVVGNFSGVKQGGEAMGIDWMNRDGLREAIPPAYTQYIGEQLMAQLTEKAA